MNYIVYVILICKFNFYTFELISYKLNYILKIICAQDMFDSQINNNYQLYINYI